ncbi:MAG TPA: histidine kinase [Niabella sp.]|nr:histidine kinase [Niabella sp.]HOZ96270.1 histidine kinase [Niabella sp.]HQW14656.1 histidine kinase [Niabella sp.]HQX19795.1 histidine kinase [Niabella sp.]HQX41105.1 histidine kinase [Niabella sp.]
MPSPLSAKRFIATLIVGWIVLVNVQVYTLNIFSFPLSISIGDSLVSNTLLLLASLLILNITKYYMPTAYQFVGIIVSALVLSLLWLFISNSFLKIFYNDSIAYISFLKNSLPIRFVAAFVILLIVTTASVLWYNWQDRKKESQRKAEVEALSKEAELFKLRQQLQPHFLFNSLNSINALIGLDQEKARKMVQQLSDFLRGTLRKEESQMVSLEEEVKHLDLYLEIEKVRFGNRLQTSIDMCEDCKQALLPSLLLQPVVENAIKFGLYDTTGQTLITIDCEMENGELMISVKNPFDAQTSSPKKGTGFGLSSIKRRLYLLFARNDLLVTAAEENVFETIIKIPQ